VPGSFSEFDPDDEGDFSAQDPPRVIWFTSYSFVDNHARRFAEARQALLEKRDGYIGWAEIKEKGEDNEKYFVLASSNVCEKGKAIVSVVFIHPEDRAWAETVWRSLQPPRGKAAD